MAQVNVESMPPGPENPFNIGFFHTETELKTELGAIRDVDSAKSRIWKIKNPNVKNPMSGTSATHPHRDKCKSTLVKRTPPRVCRICSLKAQSLHVW